MRFGSWTFQGLTLSYEFDAGKKYIILDDYMKNGAWDVINGIGNIVPIDDRTTPGVSSSYHVNTLY